MGCELVIFFIFNVESIHHISCSEPPAELLSIRPPDRLNPELHQSCLKIFIYCGFINFGPSGEFPLACQVYNDSFWFASLMCHDICCSDVTALTETFQTKSNRLRLIHADCLSQHLPLTSVQVFVGLRWICSLLPLWCMHQQCARSHFQLTNTPIGTQTGAVLTQCLSGERWSNTKMIFNKIYTCEESLCGKVACWPCASSVLRL